MKPLLPRLRVAGMLFAVSGLALAACGPTTPNAAAETPFVPPTSAATRAPANTAVPPTEVELDEGYPGGTPTVPAPAPTSPPEGYPATEGSAATNTPAPTQPPAATATVAPLFITYRDFEIVPAQTTARAGQQVIFLIESASASFHQPYAGASAPFIFEALPNMGNGVSWPITFNNPQTLTILCGYHGNMSATLVIAP